VEKRIAERLEELRRLKERKVRRTGTVAFIILHVDSITVKNGERYGSSPAAEIPV
jgi:hypothetical protein